MASMLGKMFASAAQPQSPVQNLVSQIRQLQREFRGDPAQQVPMMLQRAGIPEAAIRQCMSQATEFMKVMNGGVR